MTIQEYAEILQEEWDFAQQPTYVKLSIKAAIIALKKQAPKEPILKAMDGFDFDVAAEICCPSCSSPIVNVRPRFCHYCGQALDWSDENENENNT